MGESGEVIDLDNYSSEFGLLFEWDVEMKKIYCKHCIIESSKTLDDLMKKFIKSVKKKRYVFEDAETFHGKLFSYIQFFYLYYKKLKCSVTSNYLDNMEELLTIYCNAILKSVNKCDLKNLNMNTSCQRILTTLIVYLLNKEDYIFHVLIKMDSYIASPAYRKIINHIYINLLLRNRPRQFSDEAFCRGYLLFLKWKEIRKEKDWESMDKKMFELYRRTPDCIEKSPMLKKILRPEKTSLEDVVIGLCDTLKNIQVSYFNYINSKKIRETEQINVCIDLDDSDDEDGRIQQTSEDEEFMEAYKEAIQSLSVPSDDEVEQVTIKTEIICDDYQELEQIEEPTPHISERIDDGSENIDMHMPEAAQIQSPPSSPNSANASYLEINESVLEINSNPTCDDSRQLINSELSVRSEEIKNNLSSKAISSEITHSYLPALPDAPEIPIAEGPENFYAYSADSITEETNVLEIAANARKKIAELHDESDSLCGAQFDVESPLKDEFCNGFHSDDDEECELDVVRNECDEMFTTVDELPRESSINTDGFQPVEHLVCADFSSIEINNVQSLASPPVSSPSNVPEDIPSAKINHHVGIMKNRDASVENANSSVRKNQLSFGVVETNLYDTDLVSIASGCRNIVDLNGGVSNDLSELSKHKLHKSETTCAVANGAKSVADKMSIKFTELELTHKPVAISNHKVNGLNNNYSLPAMDVATTPPVSDCNVSSYGDIRSPAYKPIDDFKEYLQSKELMPALVDGAAATTSTVKNNGLNGQSVRQLRSRQTARTPPRITKGLRVSVKRNPVLERAMNQFIQNQIEKNNISMSVRIDFDKKNSVVKKNCNITNMGRIFPTCTFICNRNDPAQCETNTSRPFPNCTLIGDDAGFLSIPNGVVPGKVVAKPKEQTKRKSELQSPMSEVKRRRGEYNIESDRFGKKRKRPMEKKAVISKQSTSVTSEDYYNRSFRIAFDYY